LSGKCKLSDQVWRFTAQVSDNSIYSRCFYPRYGVAEDPVTGSAHCLLAPYWCERLNIKKIHAEQGLQRRGELSCELIANRVILSGKCKLYLKGEIFI